jgi:hypothetical protein
MRSSQMTILPSAVLHQLSLPLDGSSGRFVGLIEALIQADRLHILDEVSPEEVQDEIPFDKQAQAATGCSRFVRLRDGRHALIV